MQGNREAHEDIVNVGEMKQMSNQGVEWMGTINKNQCPISPQRHHALNRPITKTTRVVVERL